MSGSNLKSISLLLAKLRFDDKCVRFKSYFAAPRFRPSNWLQKKERVLSNDNLTLDNKNFLQEVLLDKKELQNSTSPLLNSDFAQVEWTPFTRRTGLIARKIGNYPLWMKNGKKVQTTLVQVVDNHVIKYIPPEEFKPKVVKNRVQKEKNTLGCLLVGSETIDPCTVTKEYCGLFNTVGMLPKRFLSRFMISPHAALPTGTPLLATHFRVGDYLDVRAKTIDRGFQGVMKRWGFKGMPASHGVTKTHRRPGNIGSGGNKARVWPGTKMPGHMGNRWRVLRGVKVLRINTQHNVMWLMGVAIPGETGAMCYLYDTILPKRKLTSAPPCPTHVQIEDLPIEYVDESIHKFDDPTILFEDN